MLSRFHVVMRHLKTGSGYRPLTENILDMARAIAHNPLAEEHVHRPTNRNYRHYNRGRITYAQHLTERLVGPHTHGLYESERWLLESVALHRIKNRVKQVRDEWSGLMVATIGAMMQQRLTLLFCELDPDTHEQLLALGDSGFISGQEWYMELRGASAAAKTVYAANAISGMTVYLPDVFTDVIHATDLIIDMGCGVHLAVGVRSCRGQEETSDVVMCLKRKNDRPERAQLWKGAGRITEKYGILHQPVLVQTRAPRSVLHNPEASASLVEELKRAIERTVVRTGIPTHLRPICT